MLGSGNELLASEDSNMKGLVLEDNLSSKKLILLKTSRALSSRILFCCVGLLFEYCKCVLFFVL